MAVSTETIQWKAADPSRGREIGHQFPGGGVIRARAGRLAEKNLQTGDTAGQVVKGNVAEGEERRDQ